MAFAFPEEKLKAAIQAAKDGDLERAESLCRKLLSIHPNSPDTLQILGLVLKNEGKLDDAELAFILEDPTARDLSDSCECSNVAAGG